jgi:hypothetical protein
MASRLAVAPGARPGEPLLLPAPRGSRRSQRAAVYATALSHGLFGLVPVIFTAFFMYAAIRAHAFAVDFHGAYVPAGLRILHGLSPYPDPHSPAVLLAGHPGAGVELMVYPASGALLFVPFALLPHLAADVMFTLLTLAAVALTLHLLGVRDWRLYGLVLLWPPVISGWQTANLTLLLGLGVAALWRHRDRAWLAGLILATLVSVKLILWPLGLWLLATRRYTALAYTVVAGIAVNAAAWGILGYSELPRYLRLLHALDNAAEDRAYSTFSLARHVGASGAVATTVGVVIATLAALACFAVGRRGRHRDSFAICVGVALLATPIAWLHYFALLLVPLALLRPRFGPLWLAPLVLVVCPPTAPASWQIVLALSVAAILVMVSLRSSSGHTARIGRSAHRLA